jgi:tyrosine-protein kinase Etk/Wzc
MTAFEGASQELDLRLAWRALRRHVAWVAGIPIVLLTLAGLYLFIAKPTYEAETTVKLPNGGSALGAISDLLAMDKDRVTETYLAIARSVNVRTRAARLLELDQKPDWKGLTMVQRMKRLDDMIVVTNLKNSDILVFSVRNKDAIFAADLANASASGFIEANLDFNRHGASSQRAFLERQLEEIRGYLDKKQQSLSNVSSAKQTLPSVGQGSSRDDDGVSLLKSQLTQFEIERATLLSRYSEDHPHVKEVDAKIEKSKLELEELMAHLPNDEMQMGRLVRDASVYEQTYDLILEKLQEARMSENVDSSGMVVVDIADIPDEIVAPRPVLILAAALVGGLAMGIGAALLLGLYRDAVEEEDLRAIDGMPLLAVVPDFSEGTNFSRNRQRFSNEYLIVQKRFEFTYYAESFRIMRTGLSFLDTGRPLRSLMALSPDREEGKSLVSSNLAIVYAMAGKKVLLIDADLRAPAIDQVFGIRAPLRGGLAALLSGQTSLDACLVKGPLPGLTLMPALKGCPNPAELLSSSLRLEKLLQSCQSRFDLVIFDAPPVLPVTDGVLLGAKLDGVIMIARAEKTRRSNFAEARARLVAARVRVLGSVFNGVRKHSSKYGYGTYGGGGAKTSSEALP